MLEPKDLQKIGEELGKVIEQNVTPQFDSLHHKVESLDRRVGRIESEMVTKSYLDDKLAELEGGLITKLRKEDTKLNHLVDILKQRKVLTEQDAKQLAEFQIFPKTS